MTSLYTTILEDIFVEIEVVIILVPSFSFGLSEDYAPELVDVIKKVEEDLVEISNCVLLFVEKRGICIYFSASISGHV